VRCGRGTRPDWAVTLCLDPIWARTNECLPPFDRDEPEDVLIPLLPDNRHAAISARWVMHEILCSIGGGDERNAAWETLLRVAEELSDLRAYTTQTNSGLHKRVHLRPCLSHPSAPRVAVTTLRRTAATSKGDFLESLKPGGCVATCGGVRH